MYFTLFFLLVCGSFFCSAETAQITAKNASARSRCYYFAFPCSIADVRKESYRKLQDFALKSCNMKIILRNRKICGTFENKVIPCPGFILFLHELVRNMKNNPQKDWNTLLQDSAGTLYGKAGGMMLAYFREKQEEPIPSAITLSRHQMLFDMMEQRTAKNPVHNRAIRITRAETDLLTLRSFKSAKRHRMTGTIEQLHKRCSKVWDTLPEGSGAFSTVNVNSVEHFRKIYLTMLKDTVLQETKEKSSADIRNIRI